MNEINIIVAGSRYFNDYELLSTTIDNYIESNIKSNLLYNLLPINIISGDARGADTLGAKYGEERGYNVYHFPADWSKGPSAGYTRNLEMAHFAKSDNNVGVLIAFWDGLSKGTKHMIDIANSLNLDTNICRF